MAFFPLDKMHPSQRHIMLTKKRNLRDNLASSSFDVLQRRIDFLNFQDNPVSGLTIALFVDLRADHVLLLDMVEST